MKANDLELAYITLSCQFQSAPHVSKSQCCGELLSKVQMEVLSSLSISRMFHIYCEDWWS